MVSQEDYMLFNQYNAQLNALTNQKNQLKMVLENLKNTLEEVKKSETKELYKNLGAVMIKTTKDKIEKDLNNEIESLNVRIKTLEKQEDIFTKKLEEIKNKIEKEMAKENKK